MNGEHRYNIPMFGVKQWYKQELAAVGHLASMEDAYLRRMYASKVVSGMNHLSKALEEKVNDPGYEHKKRDLQLMKDGVKRAMEHLKKEYEVTEDNISYKWNTGANKNTTMPSTVAPMSMPSSFEPNMNVPPSFNENTLSLNSEEEPALNENMGVLTLNNMKNFATAKTGNSNTNMKNTLSNTNTKNVLNLNKNNSLNLNNKNTLNLNNKNTLNLNNKNTLNLNNKNTLNLNNSKNKNNNKNKNTLIGGRRRRNRRYTRRN